MMNQYIKLKGTFGINVRSCLIDSLISNKRNDYLYTNDFNHSLLLINNESSLYPWQLISALAMVQLLTTR